MTIKINPAKKYRVTTFFTGDPNRQSMTGQEILQFIAVKEKFFLITQATTDQNGRVFAKSGQLLFHEEGK